MSLAFSSWCRAGGWVTAMLLGVVGAWIVLPSRDVRGNTLFEQRIDSCTLDPSGIGISLFLGNGGAMTSYWYSVTERAPLSPFRHQIFYAYASPIITSIRCRAGDTLDLIGPTSTRSLSVGQMAASLRTHPLLFVRDVAAQAPVRRRGSIDLWGYGLLIVSCSGLVLTSATRLWSAMTGRLDRYLERQFATLGGYRP